MRGLALLTLSIVTASAVDVRAQATEPDSALETRVWLDRGDEPVLHRGDEVRIFYRTSQDAFAAIFRINTDGAISLIFPQYPGADESVSGGRDYRLLLPGSPRWRVDEDRGVGYFFMVASPDPLDFSAFSYEPEGGWDLSAVGEVVYADPYVAIDDYVAVIVPDWEQIPYALDFITYNVGAIHSYPRFLCYDCHGFQTYAAWNPYDYACESIRVVIWDDPYFYPSYRYAGTRVVVPRPLRALPRYGVTTRVVGATWTPLVRVREAPPRTVVQYKEPTAARRITVPTPVRRSTAAARSRHVTPRGMPTPPTLQRRSPTPSARLPARLPPSRASRPAPTRATVTPSRSSSGTRVAPPSRPSARSSTTPRRAPARVAPSPRSSPTTAGRRPPAASRSATSRPVASRPTTSRSVTSRPVTSRSATSRPATSRPTTRSRPPTASRPTVRPSTGSRPTARPSAPRPTARARPTPRRRPGG